MYVRDWMTRAVVTVTPEDTLLDAARIIKEKGIKHLPVLKDGKLLGMLSDRDIRENLPSKATDLDVHELHYILQKTPVKTLMRKKVHTTSPGVPIEEAARDFLDLDIGCLPVVEDGRLVGIVSDRDIFRALVDISGVRHGGHRIHVTLRDEPGSIRALADILRKHGFGLACILTSYENVRKGHRAVVIRTAGDGDFKAMRAEIASCYKDAEVIKA